MQLGKYELHEIIGKGGFGTVYRATDIPLDRVVALKQLHPALTIDPDFVDRFQREAKMAARLKHTNIVPIYDLAQIDGQFLISMEYLPGGSLKNRIDQQGPLPFAAALEVTRQVSSALQYAHDQGLIHRDLKPGNILFDTDGNAYVSDFGFAKVFNSSLSSSTSNRGMVGTPPYMAPEIWLGEAVSPATDLYALACMFYETLTARPLFDGDSPPVIMARHFRPLDTLNLPADAPAGLASVLLKALAQNPADRFSSVNEFFQALNATSQEAVPQTLPTPLPTPEPLPEPSQPEVTPPGKEENLPTPAPEQEAAPDILQTPLPTSELLPEPSQPEATPPVKGESLPTPSPQPESKNEPLPTPPPKKGDEDKTTATSNPAPKRKGLPIWAWILVGLLIAGFCVLPAGLWLVNQIFTPVDTGTSYSTQAPVLPAATSAPQVQNTAASNPSSPTSSTIIKTPTQLPTATSSTSNSTPILLTMCKSTTRGLCISAYAEADAPSNMIVILRQDVAFSGSYYLQIDQKQFTCAIYKNYPNLLFCTGPKMAQNVSLRAELYRLSPEQLIATGDIIIFLPTAVPTEPPSRYP